VTKITCRLTFLEISCVGVTYAWPMSVTPPLHIPLFLLLVCAVMQVVCDGFLVNQNANGLSSLSVRHHDVAVRRFSNVCVRHSAAVRFVKTARHIATAAANLISTVTAPVTDFCECHWVDVKVGYVVHRHGACLPLSKGRWTCTAYVDIPISLWRLANAMPDV